MAVVHDRHSPMSRREENACAFMFCLTWLGFFAAIGALTWILTSL
jgi:hypothetical protein